MSCGKTDTTSNYKFEEIEVTLKQYSDTVSYNKLSAAIIEVVAVDHSTSVEIDSQGVHEFNYIPAYELEDTHLRNDTPFQYNLDLLSGGRITDILGVNVFDTFKAGNILDGYCSIWSAGRVTPNITPTPTPTQSVTPTITVTPSIGPSATPSPSETPSVTAATVTPSITPSTTVSLTPTQTPIPSTTPSMTPSSTPSVTASVTPSPSVTASVTPTPSITASVGASMTPTPTVTASITPSVTPTMTPTLSTTPSVTASITPSITASVSPTLTPTISTTPSVTASITPSVTPTLTPTISLTPSVTASITPSITPTITPTISVSITPEPTSTPTMTPTMTPSMTVSVTPTPSALPPTPTPSTSAPARIPRGLWSVNVQSVPRSNMRNTGNSFTSVGDTSGGDITFTRLVNGSPGTVYGFNNNRAYVIDTTTNAVVNDFAIPGGTAIDMTYSPVEDALFFLHNNGTPATTRITTVDPNTGSQTSSTTYGVNVNYPRVYGGAIDYNPATGTVWTVYSTTTNGNAFLTYYRNITTAGWGPIVTLQQGTNPGAAASLSFYCGGLTDPRIYVKRVSTAGRRVSIYNINTNTIELDGSLDFGSSDSNFWVSTGNYAYAYVTNVIYRYNLTTGAVTSISATASTNPVLDMADGNIISTNGRLVYKLNTNTFTLATNYGTFATSGTWEINSAVTFLG